MMIPAPLGHPRDCCQEVIWLERFGHEVVHARALRFLAVLRHGICRKRDDGNIGDFALETPDDPRRCRMTGYGSES